MNRSKLNYGLKLFFIGFFLWVLSLVTFPPVEFSPGYLLHVFAGVLVFESGVVVFKSWGEES